MTERTGARGYGIDLRTRIVRAVLKGDDPKAVAQRFEVPLRTVQLYVKKHGAGTLHERACPTGRRRTIQPDHEQVFLDQLTTSPDASLHEHAAQLEEKTGLKISYRTVDRAFRRHHITYKKNEGRQRTE